MANKRNQKPRVAASQSGATDGWDGRLAPRLWAPTAILAAAVMVALGVGMVMAGGRSDTPVSAQCPPGKPDCVRQPVHWHADVALYIRGKKFDFGQPQFLSTEDKHLSENVHIHKGAKDDRTNVIHIHREQTTWDEFFTSLGFTLTDASLTDKVDEKTCLKMPGSNGEKLCNGATETFKFFKNGVRVDGIALMDISDLDRVLISFGSESEEQAREQFETVTDLACILSESCKSRIDPNEPPEECSKSSNSCTG
jgi:hypothetical protein